MTTQPSSAPAPAASPGPARVSLVEQHLLTDAKLKTHLGPRDTALPRRDGRTIMFPKFAVDLTTWIASQVPEVMHVKGTEVIDFARQFLAQNDETTRMQEAAALAAELAAEELQADSPFAPVPAPAPAPVAPPAVAPAQAAETPAPATAPRKRGRPKKVVETAGAAPIVSPAGTPPTGPAEKTEKTSAAESAPPMNGQNSPTDAVPVGLAIYSLLHAADALAEKDTLPEQETRRATLTAAMASYFAVVPVSIT